MSGNTLQEEQRPQEQTTGTSILKPSRLQYPVEIKEGFGIDRMTWTSLVEVIYPNAKTSQSVVLALSYCKTRGLDIMKRPVHIVSIYNTVLKRMVDSIWPGIGEIRTTACRTKEYAGKDATVFGPDITETVGTEELTYPEWAQVTVKRLLANGTIGEFVGPRVYWKETYAVQKSGEMTPNKMWKNRPRGQLDKCAEAAALRTGFPEEVGNDLIFDEMQHDGGEILPERRGGSRVSASTLGDEIPAEETADHGSAEFTDITAHDEGGNSVLGEGGPAADEEGPTDAELDAEPRDGWSDISRAVAEKAMRDASVKGDLSEIASLANALIEKYPARRKTIEHLRDKWLNAADELDEESKP